MTHGRLALDMGIPEENIFVLNNGDAVTFTKKGAAKAGEVPSGAVMVDGSKSIEDAVIRDRRELSSQGLVVAVVTLDKWPPRSSGSRPRTGPTTATSRPP